jgi:hypothetical protein
MKRLLAIALLVSACGVAVAPGTPAATATPSATAAVSTLSSTPTSSSALASAQASPTSTTSYWGASKLAEGGHDGPPLLDLPKAIAIDYRVSGTCVFSLGLATATSAGGLPSLTMTVTGPEITGTWRLLIKPGRYYPVVSEAVGCVYSVNVRDDH